MVPQRSGAPMGQLSCSYPVASHDPLMHDSPIQQRRPHKPQCSSFWETSTQVPLQTWSPHWHSVGSRHSG
jgi:hypothetical protein